MAKKSGKPSDTPKEPVPKYFTRAALDDKRKNGSVLGYFGYEKRGRKAKTKVGESNTKTSESIHHDGPNGVKGGAGGPESRVIDSTTSNEASPSAIASETTTKRRGGYLVRLQGHRSGREDCQT